LLAVAEGDRDVTAVVMIVAATRLPETYPFGLQQAGFKAIDQDKAWSFLFEIRSLRRRPAAAAD
jgi:hypothetical protein